MEVTHLFFDLDGTLSDPQEGITRCYAYALSELGLAAPKQEDLRRFIGPPLRIAFAELLGTSDSELIEQAVLAYRKRFAEKGMYENILYPEIPDTLASLQKEGFIQFVVTSKALIFAEPIVAHFGLSKFFQSVHGPSIQGKHDNKAELVGHLLSELEIRAENAVMIGDRKEDIMAGIQNGCRTIGVLYGYGSESELRDAKAEVLISTPLELRNVLSLIKPAQAQSHVSRKVLPGSGLPS